MGKEQRSWHREKGGKSWHSPACIVHKSLTCRGGGQKAKSGHLLVLAWLQDLLFVDFLAAATGVASFIFMLTIENEKPSTSRFLRHGKKYSISCCKLLKCQSHCFAYLLWTPLWFSLLQPPFQFIFCQFSLSQTQTATRPWLVIYP